MIASLTGRLASKHPGGVIIDVQGVGYDVLIPLSTYYQLPALNQSVTLVIHTHVREDAIQLYGFLTQRHKAAFLLLLGVSGSGPKLSVISIATLNVDALTSRLLKSAPAVLVRVPDLR